MKEAGKRWGAGGAGWRKLAEQIEPLGSTDRPFTSTAITAASKQRRSLH